MNLCSTSPTCSNVWTGSLLSLYREWRVNFTSQILPRITCPTRLKLLTRGFLGPNSKPNATWTCRRIFWSFGFKRDQVPQILGMKIVMVAGILQLHHGSKCSISLCQALKTSLCQIVMTCQRNVVHKVSIKIQSGFGRIVKHLNMKSNRNYRQATGITSIIYVQYLMIRRNTRAVSSAP